MKTQDEIKAKIEELEEEAEEVDNEFEEALADEDLDEFSEQGEKLREEFDVKKEIVEKQIEILEWVLGE